MTVPAATKPRWETREYAQIVAARFRPPHLIVAFADGTEVAIKVDRFDNQFIRSQRPDWARVTIGAHEVVVPTATGEIGIPWDDIRAMTDPEFAADWADLTTRTAGDIGARLRELREGRRLVPAEVAQRVGIAIATVVDVETGRHPIDLALLDRLLAAMGCTADDLIAAEGTGIDPASAQETGRN